MKTREMTTKLARVGAIILLAVGLMASTAMAQDKHDAGSRPSGFYIGVEMAAGTLEPISGTTYGNTLVLNYYNENETRCLTVSLDYSTAQFIPDSFIVTGGSWSLVVFRDGIYQGTIYGKVLSGNVLISSNNNGDPTQLTDANVQSTGGMGAFEGKAFKDLSGAFSATTDLRSSGAKGNMALNF